jgi:DNA adenine methylase
MIEPFLKWAGGKRWLATRSLPQPAEFDRYIEPFLGGAAVFFSILPARALLSDLNSELIDLYRVMRDNPLRLTRMLQVHHAVHNKNHYYAVRAWLPECPIERAARTLYLNRTCWNGLYRVNQNGQFNVPIGTKCSVIFDNDDFIKISEALSRAELRCCDFSDAIENAGSGDFLFVDPPYTAKHNLNGFLKYNEKIFSWADQLRLRDSLAGAIARGAAVVVTNADHESVRDLYDGLARYVPVARASVLAADARRRGPTTEAMFVANIN